MSENQNQPTTPTLTVSSVSNLREVMGTLALVVVVGALALAAVAVYLQPTNVTVVLASVMQLASTVIAFFFGAKSSQQVAQAQASQ